ncbi:ribonuclease Z [Hydrogenimonas sp.]
MTFTFLGTSAGAPTRTRNVSALALQLQNSREWALFDCGEGTQYRLMQTPLSSFNLAKIYITHLHGDHLYGLFGLLASRGLQRAERPLQIFGPPGISKVLEVVLRLSQLNLPFDLEVIELKEGACGRFGDLQIDAVGLSHSIETYGFVLSEAPRPGRFDAEAARRLGIPEGPLFGRLKRGETITLPDGRTIDGRRLVGAPKRGRKAIVGGDNDTPLLFSPLGDAADLMIHEATYTQRDFEQLPRKFMHSTARSVAVAASNMGIKKLILTHISPRYDTEARVSELLEEAKRHFDGEVEVAYDLMRVEV